MDHGSGLIEFFLTLPVRLYNAGVNMVKSLWEGFKAKWAEFTGWVSDKFEWLSSLNPFGDDEGSVSLQPTSGRSPSSYNSQFTTNNILRSQQAAPVVFDKSVTRTESIILQANLDGEKIYENVLDRQQLEQARGF